MLLYRKVFTFTIDNDECMQSFITHSRNGSCVGADGFDKYLTVFIVAFNLDGTNEPKKKQKINRKRQLFFNMVAYIGCAELFYV